MLDLCAGLGGASQAMRARGWRVVTVDSELRFGCTHTADIRTWRWVGPRPDLVWASPPCTEFARESMPWSRKGITPDLSIVMGCLRVIAETRPRFWVLENVRGAVRWLAPILGPPRQIAGPFFLWGNFPPLGVGRLKMRPKESYPSSRPDLRAKVPEAISLAVAVAVESQGALDLEAA
jgi:hypothetical protein